MSQPDYQLIRSLLQIAHSASPPEYLTGEDSGESIEVVFDGVDGWSVVCYYDGGELDCIDRFVSPTGQIISLWDSDLNQFGIDDTDRCVFSTLQNWRGCDDTDRLIASLPRE